MYENLLAFSLRTIINAEKTFRQTTKLVFQVYTLLTRTSWAKKFDFIRRPPRDQTRGRLGTRLTQLPTRGRLGTRLLRGGRT